MHNADRLILLLQELDLKRFECIVLCCTMATDKTTTRQLIPGNVVTIEYKNIQAKALSAGKISDDVTISVLNISLMLNILRYMNKSLFGNS